MEAEHADMLERVLRNLAVEVEKLRDEQPTLRDRFAMAALQGDLAASAGNSVQLEPKDMPSFAAWCYQLADAMLAARATTQGEQRGEG